MPISFDRVADDYDRTRGYPPGVQERIGAALVEAAGITRAAPRILELGVGTGRIALPIVRAGYPYTGVDVSPLMLDKLRAALQQIPGAGDRVTLVEGDITHLPFASASFDAVLTVHVYHLVDPAVVAAESLRVLGHPGVLLNGRDVAEDDNGPDEITDAWSRIVHDLGWDPPVRIGAGRLRVGEEWQRLGGQVDEFTAVEWEDSVSPRTRVDTMARRLVSRTWAMPEEIASETAARLWAWAATRYGEDLDRNVPYRRRFLIERARFV